VLALEGEMPGVEGSAGGGVQVTSASVVKLRGVLAVGIEHRLDLAAGDLSDRTYGRVWQKASDQALTPEEASSRLARRPYDLRHAAVFTWLNGGVSPTQVAEWAATAWACCCGSTAMHRWPGTGSARANRPGAWPRIFCGRLHRLTETVTVGAWWQDRSGCDIAMDVRRG